MFAMLYHILRQTRHCPRNSPRKGENSGCLFRFGHLQGQRDCHWQHLMMSENLESLQPDHKQNSTFPLPRHINSNNQKPDGPLLLRYPAITKAP
ncbi:hypothetical protein TMES_01235 [Thalassospira mesophila]|uniref:Uncharacterized protein n=1 Tax=Thalassospira mesophila TaxID=1293891 RepID=A0A1Y2L4I0_9PROT|nr:hypothetical protein TMES_01235 [Thalassospira mesophila]